MIYAHEAIRNIHPEARIIIGDTLDDIICKDVDENMLSIDLTSDKLKTEMDRLQGEFDAQEYARKRQGEYPGVQDQLDMIYWDGVNGTTTHKDIINAIKAKYPKP